MDVYHSQGIIQIGSGTRTMFLSHEAKRISGEPSEERRPRSTYSIKKRFELFIVNWEGMFIRSPPLLFARAFARSAFMLYVLITTSPPVLPACCPRGDHVSSISHMNNAA